MLAPTLLRGCLIAAAFSAGGLAGCGLEQSDLQVKVVDAASGQMIQGATVEVGAIRRASTNMLGLVKFSLRPGTHEIAVRHPRYAPFADAVTVFSGMGALATVRLDPAPVPTPGPSTPAGASPGPGASPSPGPSTPVASPAAPEWQTVTLFGRVTDPSGGRLAKATLFVESDFGIPYGHGQTNAQGEYKLSLKLPKGKPSVRVAAMSDGFVTKVRYASMTGNWRMDFAGSFALQPIVIQPDTPPEVTVGGRVEDTQGRPLKFALVRAEAEDTRHPFQGYALVADGKYVMNVPTRMPLRFTAAALNHRSVTFVETIKAGSREYDFIGYRGLSPTTGLE